MYLETGIFPEFVFYRENKNMSENVVVGLDLSLTGTGMCIKDGQGIRVETIKTLPKDFANDLSRLIHIREAILSKLPADVKMVCIEDFFTGAHAASAIKIAMLGTVIRLALYEKGISFTLVAPATLKKYILGKGVGEKSLILREVYKKYPNIDVKDDNQADSVVLCHIAESLCLKRSGVEQESLLKPQEEVLKGLLAAASERGYNWVKQSD